MALVAAPVRPGAGPGGVPVPQRRGGGVRAVRARHGAGGGGVRALRPGHVPADLRRALPAVPGGRLRQPPRLHRLPDMRGGQVCSGRGERALRDLPRRQLFRFGRHQLRLRGKPSFLCICNSYKADEREGERSAIADKREGEAERQATDLRKRQPGLPAVRPRPSGAELPAGGRGLRGVQPAARWVLCGRGLRRDHRRAVGALHGLRGLHRAPVHALWRRRAVPPPVRRGDRGAGRGAVRVRGGPPPARGRGGVRLARGPAAAGGRVRALRGGHLPRGQSMPGLRGPARLLRRAGEHGLQRVLGL